MFNSICALVLILTFSLPCFADEIPSPGNSPPPVRVTTRIEDSGHWYSAYSRLHLFRDPNRGESNPVTVSWKARFNQTDINKFLFAVFPRTTSALLKAKVSTDDRSYDFPARTLKLALADPNLKGCRTRLQRFEVKSPQRDLQELVLWGQVNLSEPQESGVEIPLAALRNSLFRTELVRLIAASAVPRLSQPVVARYLDALTRAVE